MPPNIFENYSLKRMLKALSYTMNGFRVCFQSEAAFRQEIYLSCILIPLAFWLGESLFEQILLSGVVVIILIVELLNTAIERAIDRISLERHELSKESKDMGSAAVFLSLALCGFTWSIILIPKLF